MTVKRRYTTDDKREAILQQLLLRLSSHSKELDGGVISMVSRLMRVDRLVVSQIWKRAWEDVSDEDRLDVCSQRRRFG